MLRLSICIASAIAIAASGCGSDGPFTGGDRKLETVHENVSSPDLSVPVPSPDNGEELGQLGPAPPVPSIDPNVLHAALADATVVGKLRELGLQLATIAGVSAPAGMRLIAAPDRQAVEV